MWDAAGELVCVVLYRRGAREVVRRLSWLKSQVRQQEARPTEPQELRAA